MSLAAKLSFYLPRKGVFKIFMKLQKNLLLTPKVISSLIIWPGLEMTMKRREYVDPQI